VAISSIYSEYKLIQISHGRLVAQCAFLFFIYVVKIGHKWLLLSS
jgi:hypothetical protein